MVFFDITNKPFDLKGDELIESATKFLEEADRKKQQEIEEQEQRPKTPVARKKKAVPPRWPTPKPDSIHSGLPDEETGSEFRSDTSTLCANTVDGILSWISSGVVCTGGKNVRDAWRR